MLGRARSPVIESPSAADDELADHTRASARDHAHHLLRTYVSERPRLYLPFARRKYPGPSPEVVGPETELVIDGYTRCASTFTVYAFQIAQARPVRLAHHLHAPAQLIAAARRGVPTIAVIREPDGVVLSQVQREPGVSIGDGLWSYARFYARLMPYRTSFVVADYEDLTTDFSSVVRRVNEQFGTQYTEFVHNERNVEACMELIRYRPTLSRELLGFESGTATLADAREAVRHLEAAPADDWIPSESRKKAKETIRRQLSAPSVQARRRQAHAIYAQFTGSDGRNTTPLTGGARGV